MNSTVEPNDTFRTVGLLHRERSCSMHRRSALRTSHFEMTSSFLLALMVIIAWGVAILLVMFISLETEVVECRIPLVEVVGGGGASPTEIVLTFEPPGTVEAEVLSEPTVEETIKVLTDSVTNVAASLDQSQSDKALSSDGASHANDRRAGPGDANYGTVPRFERWQLEFSARGLQDYAKQLDHFEIELGLIGEQVDYVYDMSTLPKHRSRLPSDQDRRLYFFFTSPSPLQRYDAQLVSQAGIRVAGRMQVKFISKDLEDQLALIEMEHAKTKGHGVVSEIIKTIFASTPHGEGYQFQVTAQRYRR